MSDIVTRFLPAISETLCRFLDRTLPALGGGDWWSIRVMEALTSHQRERLVAHKARSLTALDLAALLRVLDRNWYEVSQHAGWTSEVRNFVKEAQSIRNRWAHLGSAMPADEDIYRDLDTLERLARALGEAEGIAAKIAEAKRNVIGHRSTVVGPGAPESGRKDVPETQNGSSTGVQDQATPSPQRDAAEVSGRYEPLIRWLADRSTDSITMTFAQLEKRLNNPLPKSARLYPAFWSSGNHLGRTLGRIGWRASLKASTGAILFVREDSKHTDDPTTSGALQDDITLPEGRPDLVLIGCVKSKLPGKHRAKDLFTSPLFLGRRRAAEASGAPWFILSAKYGLLAPDALVDTYDVSLNSASRAERVTWSARVLSQLRDAVGSLSGKVVEIHAGAAYRNHGLIEGLESEGARVLVPLEGAKIGEQLQRLSAPHP